MVGRDPLSRVTAWYLFSVFRVARNLKVNTNESTRIKAKKEKTAKERRKIKRGENHGIEKATKERKGGEVEMTKAKRKGKIGASTVKRKSGKVYNMA